VESLRKFGHSSLEGLRCGEPQAYCRFPWSSTITNTQLLTLACDVLIPAALENQITEENVHQIQADIVAEAANGPVTLMADQALEARV